MVRRADERTRAPEDPTDLKAKSVRVFSSSPVGRFSFIAFISAFARGIGVLVVCVASVWASLVLWYQLPDPLWQCIGAIGIVLACMAAAARALWQRHWWGVVPALVVLLDLLVWWAMLEPSNDRHWAPDVERLLRAEIAGSEVRLHNVRNFDWRSDTDFTPRWETRAYDLDQLVSADLILSYWMGPAIAHSLLSFGFRDGARVVFSLEIRKEDGESFSALGGFFRRFETVIVAADERDIVRVRTNVRGEDVHLYRLQLRPEHLRTLFLGYVGRANGLHDAPRFYNTLTSNCTTIVVDLARQINPDLPLDVRLLLSGYLPGYAYERGLLTPRYSLATLTARGDIVSRAQSAEAKRDFSATIRQGVPGEESGGK